MFVNDKASSSLQNSISIPVPMISWNADLQPDTTPGSDRVSAIFVSLEDACFFAAIAASIPV